MEAPPIPGEARRDGRLRRQHDVAARDVLQQVFLVAAGGAAVAGEYRAIRERKRRGKPGKPGQMRGRQEAPRQRVGAAGRVFHHPAIVVATQRGAAERDLGVGSTRRIERAADQVAEVDDQIGRLPPQVGQHRVEGEQVSVDIGDNGNAHLAQVTRRRETVMWSGEGKAGIQTAAPMIGFGRPPMDRPRPR